MRRFALFTTLAVAAWTTAASAGTTTSTTGGVEVILMQPDVAKPVSRSKPRRASPSPTPATAAERELPGARELVALALGRLGTPYVWGGQTPSGFDCSGFTQWAYGRLGIAIPRTADLQFAAGKPVDDNPAIGDLVFFQTYDYGASHVGIYLGGGRFVNALRPDVHIATFASEYFRSRYLGARRFLPD